MTAIDGGFATFGNIVIFASSLNAGDMEGRPLTVHGLVRTDDCVFLYDSVDVVPTQVQGFGEP